MSPPQPQPDDRCGASSHALRSLLMSVMRSPDLADHAGLLVMFGSDAAVAERCPAVRKLFSPSPSATEGQHEQRSSPWSLPRNHHSSLAPVFGRSLVTGLSMLALHLLQSPLVYLLLQRVLAEDEWAERLTDSNWRALSPLFWSHANLYGPIEVDMDRHLDHAV